MIWQMAGDENLRAVGFYEGYPDGKPSDFIDMLSDPDHALWPGESTVDNRIAFPKGLTVSMKERQTNSHELVLSTNLSNTQLIVMGYGPDESEPHYTYEWDFPTRATLAAGVGDKR